MGSEDGDERELPIHEVIINYDFEISPYLVSYAEYMIFCKETNRINNIQHKNTKYPITYISWNDCMDYCKWLSIKTGNTYRLPSESEWEFTCRANTSSRWSFGDDINKLKEYAREKFNF